MGRAAEIAVHIVGDSADLKKALRDSEKDAEKWSVSLEQHSASVTTALSLVTGAVAGMGVSMRAAAVRDAKVLADALDISVTSLTSWQFAAESVGIGADKLGDIIKDVSDKVGDYLLNGGGEAKDAIEGLGLSVDDLRGKRPDELLETIFTKIAQVADPNIRTNMLESFADEAVRLAPLLDNDAELLDKLRAKAEQLGVAITPEDAASVTALADSYHMLEGAVEGALNQMTVMAGDNLAEPVEALADLVALAGENLHLLDEALLLTAGVLASRATPAALEWVSATRERIKLQAQMATGESIAADLVHKFAKEEQSRLQTTLKAFDAERALEQQRFSAQITDKGRIKSAGRLAEIRQAELAIASQLDTANKKLLTTQQNMIAAQTHYNRVATIGGRVTQGLKSAVSFLGGPAGVAMLAATAIATLAIKYETADEKTKKLRKSTDQLADSMLRMTLLEANAAVDQAYADREAVLVKLTKAEQKYKAALAGKVNDGTMMGGLAGAKSDVEHLQAEYDALDRRYDVAKTGLDAAMERMKWRNNAGDDDGGWQQDAVGKAQERSRAALVALDMQFADEQKKLWLHHQQRLDQIDELQLSEKQIRAAGYSSLSELQEAYQADSLALYERQKTELNEREILELNKTRERQRDEIAQMREGFLTKEQLELEHWQQRQVELAEWFLMEQEAYRGNKEELARIEQEYLWLSGENQRQYRENVGLEGDQFWSNYAESIRKTAENTDQIWASTLTNISSRTSSTIMDSIRDWKGMGSLIESTFASAGEAIIQTLVEIGVQRLTLWALEKTIGTAANMGYLTQVSGQASSQVAMAGLNAFTSTAAIPIVGPVLAPGAMSAAMATATPLAGAAIAAASSSLAGMAHEGIDAIPREGTWLLDRGERVYTNESAQRIDAMHDKVMTAGGAGGVQSLSVEIHTHDLPPVEGSAELTEDRMKLILRRVDSDQAEKAHRGDGQAYQALKQRFGANDAASVY